MRDLGTQIVSIDVVKVIVHTQDTIIVETKSIMRELWPVYSTSNNFHISFAMCTAIWYPGDTYIGYTCISRFFINIFARYTYSCSYYILTGKQVFAGHIAATLYDLSSALRIKSSNETQADQDTPCTSKLNTWKGKGCFYKEKASVRKDPLENYDFNKVTILGEKQKKRKAFDLESFNPAPEQTEEVIHDRMHTLVSHFTESNCSFRAMSLWQCKYLK